MAIWNSINTSEEFGITVEQPRLEWSKVMQRKNQIIDKFVGGKSPYLKKMDVDVVMGEATFLSPDSIQVNDQTYTAERFLIGVGSESILLPIEGIEHAVTSKEVLFMDQLPSSMVIIGGGIIAMEFAHIFASAGTRVTVLHRGDRVLKSEDPDSSVVIQDISKQMGITIHLHSNVVKIEKKAQDSHTVHFNTPDGPLTVEGEVVIAATGRKPAIEGLQLSVAGVEYSKNGIKVNEYLQTTAERIYAAGDSIGGYMFTPIAAHQAKVAVRNALKGNNENPNYQHMTRSIFTMPPISSVGMSEQEAKEKELNYAVGKLLYAHSGTAILLGETKGHFKVLVDKNTEQILGAHFVGADADELIHLITVAMKGKLTIQDFVEIIPVHPTLAESLIEMIRSIE